MNISQPSTTKMRMKNFLLIIVALLAILFYSSLSDIFMLPPLLGICFVLFCAFMDKQQFHYLALLMLYLLFFEAGKNYPFLSTCMFFLLLYFFVMPSIRYLVHSPKYLIPFYTLGIYYGYGMYCILIGYLIGIPIPDIPLIFLLFAFVESLLLVLLV